MKERQYMELTSCCTSYADNSEPKSWKSGLFFEVHTCSKCKKKIRIEFEGLTALGTKKDFSVIDANYIKPKK